MRRLLYDNPFGGLDSKLTVGPFLETPPSTDVLDLVRVRDGELMALGGREIYVHYHNGLGRSRPKKNSGRERYGAQHEHGHQTG